MNKECEIVLSELRELVAASSTALYFLFSPDLLWRSSFPSPPRARSIVRRRARLHVRYSQMEEENGHTRDHLCIQIFAYKMNDMMPVKREISGADSILISHFKIIMHTVSDDKNLNYTFHSVRIRRKR